MTIVVGYIATKEGKAAITAAISEAKLRKADLVVVNSNRGGRELDAEESAAHDAQLALVQKELTEAGVKHVVRTLVRGQDPAADLIEIADEVNATLIVIGLRRRSPVGKLIMGSNAQSILLDANCPVLAVKAE